MTLETGSVEEGALLSPYPPQLDGRVGGIVGVEVPESRSTSKKLGGIVLR